VAVLQKNMKKIIIYTFLLGILTACGETTTPQQTQEEIDLEINNSIVNQDGIYGYYFAASATRVPSELENEDYDFRNLTITIHQIDDKTIKGQRIINGNACVFVGTVTKEGDIHHIKAKEPENDKRNGQFLFSLDEKKKIIKGEWTAYDENANVKKLLFESKKRIFAYDENLNNDFDFDVFIDTYQSDGTIETPTANVANINASNVLLKADDISNLYKGDLELIRNLIFARHGFAFQSRRMRFIFENIDWYIPISTDVSSELTEIENKNIDLLKRYEEYAERNYEFSR
jgi:hypothetical protein